MITGNCLQANSSHACGWKSGMMQIVNLISNFIHFQNEQRCTASKSAKEKQKIVLRDEHDSIKNVLVYITSHK